MFDWSVVPYGLGRFDAAIADGIKPAPRQKNISDVTLYAMLFM